MSLRSFGSSAFLHLFIILVVIFGLPTLMSQDEPLYQPQVIAMDLKIAPINNAKTTMPDPPKKPKVEKPKPTPPAPKPEPVKKPTPKPAPEPEKPKPKPAPTPEPVKEKPKEKEKEKEKPKEKETPKEKPKKPKKEEPSLEDILKSVETPDPAPAEKGEKSISDVPFDPRLPLSQAVENSIRNQIMECWNYQGGAKDQDSLVAHILVIFREDGSVIDAHLKASDQGRYGRDRAFKSLVDSAFRATRNPNCVPLKGLPVDSYKSWSKIELVFDPREMW